ncbi:MAG: putative Ig domain-containing protein [Bacteroidota bacterium]|jgi:hypothetical protein
MKKIFYIFLSILVTTVCLGQTIPDSALYLGQTPPGTTPMIFSLPVSNGFFAAERITVSSDGKQIYYSELNGYTSSSQLRIKYFSYHDNMWNGPLALFDNYMAPALSPDGGTLYFQDKCVQPMDAWYSLRNDTGWNAPSKLLNNPCSKHYLQVTESGNCYVSANPAGTIGGMDWCKLIVIGMDTTFQSLGRPINSTSDDLDFYISRDESYMIISNGGNPSALLVSYRKPDNTWTNPKNLGPLINSGTYQWGPYITNDNRYLFFSRYPALQNNRIYWVRIDNLIDSLKHTNFVPYVKSPIHSQTDTLGHLYNYQVPDSTFIDDDGNNTLTYIATLSNGNPLPAWLSFNPVTRTFSGTPTAASTISIKVTAIDTAKASVSCTFNIISVLTGVKQDENKIPKNFNLDQNYPNPFNPNTTIHYSLAKSSFVKLAIYNLLGQKIRTLQNTFQAAGEYSLVWDATDDKSRQMSSGAYFYRFQAGNMTLQKKMLLLR